MAQMHANDIKIINSNQFISILQSAIWCYVDMHVLKPGLNCVYDNLSVSLL